MKSSTIAALDRINRRFYGDEAKDFDQTRHGPWAGWQRVADAVRERLPRTRPLRVLDVGCGNGRFGRFLAEALPEVEIRWAGLDASGPLLERARTNLDRANLCAPATLEFNLLGSSDSDRPRLPRPSALWPEPSCGEAPAAAADGYDLVVAFGVFHHVPGPIQAGVFADMAEITRPGGLVVASFWQFAELDHYAGRRISWTEAVHEGWIAPEAVAEIDAQDWLLRWGAGHPLRARYCRATSLEAARAVVAESEGLLGEVDWFRADGRTGTLNVYALAERV